MSSFAVEVENVVKTFGSFVAVDHISFQVEKGEIFGFLGPNGAGKSTTIRMLCGLLLPTSGRGSVAGFDLMKEPEKIKQAIGYMSQKFSLYDDLTVMENLHFFGGIYGLSGFLQKEREEKALEMADLQKLRDQITRTLAVGWKQRLALGCAILHEPSILFLDEPTSGVDPISRRNFWNLIRQMGEKGVTTFVTTHYMDEAENCDRLALIYRGKIIALGTPSELKSKTLSQGVMEVECEPLMTALDLLKREPWVLESAIFGDGLHVIGKEGIDSEQAVKTLFEKNGILLKGMNWIRPSLEDVFVSLIERGGELRLSRAWAIARKEFIHIYRDSRSLALVILMPALLMILFGYAVTLDVKHVPFAVLDRNQTQESLSFIQRFSASPYFELPIVVQNEKEMRRLIDGGSVRMGLVLPWDFSRTIKAGKKASIQVLLDGSDSNTANIILSYVQAIARQYNQEKTFLKVEKMGLAKLSLPLEGRTRIWFNEELESKNYFIPGLIAVIMSIIGVLLTGQVIAREWEQGTMELLISTPVQKGELIIGKLFPYFLLGLLDLFLAVEMAEWVFQVPFRGSIVLLFLLSCVYIVVALALGLIISTISRTQLLANQLAMVIGFLPTFLLSGFTFVIANMPIWLQVITYGIAPRYYVTILKEIFLKGADFSLLWHETLILIGFGMAGLLVATRTFKKELR